MGVWHSGQSTAFSACMLKYVGTPVLPWLPTTPVEHSPCSIRLNQCTRKTSIAMKITRSNTHGSAVVTKIQRWENIAQFESLNAFNLSGITASHKNIQTSFLWLLIPHNPSILSYVEVVDTRMQSSTHTMVLHTFITLWRLSDDVGGTLDITKELSG